MITVSFSLLSWKDVSILIAGMIVVSWMRMVSVALSSGWRAIRRLSRFCGVQENRNIAADTINNMCFVVLILFAFYDLLIVICFL